MKYRFAILIIVCTLNSLSSFSQQFTKPKEPTFDYLTIDLTTGNPSLFWTAPTSDPQYPDPIGYIIYKRFVDALGNDYYDEIDTVDQNTFQYTDINTDGNAARAYYKIATLAPTEPSNLTVAHSEIWLTSAYDSCNAKLDLMWESYEGWSNINVNQYYKLYMGDNPDWTTFQYVADIDKFKNKYSITNVEENKDYYFYLTASRVDKPFTTYSNLYHIFTKMAIRPNYMSIDTIVSQNQGNVIYYKIDPNTEIRNFKLIRWEQADTNKSIFSAKVIEEFSDPIQSMSIDTNDTWAARTRKFYYKIDAYNGCNSTIKVTNLCNTIIPRLRPKGTTVHVQWDTLMVDTQRKPERAGNIVKYTVYRRAFTENDDVNGLGQLEIAAQEITESSIDDDLSAYKGQDPRFKILFKYYIEAIERTPDNTGITLCRSREASTEILPGVTMPTAIAPNSTASSYGHPRNILQPIINFEASYTLTVYDRWGSVIFHGSEPWDGKDSNGRYVKEGTYVYRLVVNTDSSGDVVQNGSVSVVYPK